MPKWLGRVATRCLHVADHISLALMENQHQSDDGSARLPTTVVSEAEAQRVRSVLCCAAVRIHSIHHVHKSLDEKLLRSTQCYMCIYAARYDEAVLRCRSTCTWSVIARRH